MPIDILFRFYKEILQRENSIDSTKRTQKSSKLNCVFCIAGSSPRKAGDIQERGPSVPPQKNSRKLPEKSDKRAKESAKTPQPRIHSK